MGLLISPDIERCHREGCPGDDHGMIDPETGECEACEAAWQEWLREYGWMAAVAARQGASEKFCRESGDFRRDPWTGKLDYRSVK